MDQRVRRVSLSHKGGAADAALIGRGKAAPLHDVAAFPAANAEGRVVSHRIVTGQGAELEVQCLEVGVELHVNVDHDNVTFHLLI